MFYLKALNLELRFDRLTQELSGWRTTHTQSTETQKMSHLCVTFVMLLGCVGIQVCGILIGSELNDGWMEDTTYTYTHTHLYSHDSSKLVHLSSVSKQPNWVSLLCSSTLHHLSSGSIISWEYYYKHPDNRLLLGVRFNGF